jgi:hypothetical protein
MAKTSKSIEKAQDAVLFQFQRDIRAEEKRTWLNATEQAIEQGRKNREYAERQAQLNQVRISFCNPDSPLRGSSSWSKAQWAEYRETQKAQKRAERLAAKQVNK